MQREDQTDHGNGPGTNSSESAVNHLSKSVVRENRTPRSVGTGGGQLPPVTRCSGCNSPGLLGKPVALDAWRDELEQVQDRLGELFVRPEPRQQARNVSMTLRRPEPEIKLIRVAFCEAG